MDQDGTISRPLSLGIYLKDWESFAFREDPVLVMEELAADGFSFIVLTNQAGIGHGIVEQDEADRIHQRMTVELANRGVPILEIYCCPDLPGSGSPMRKPAPGMFLQAARDHEFLLDQVLYVGDDIRDCHAAVAAGCGMILLGDRSSVDGVPPNSRLDLVRSSLEDALPEIRQFYGLEVGSQL